jgi:uncharacterized PurR-regulated membrane protein YhhQ (DUF165 family)
MWNMSNKNLIIKLVIIQSLLISISNYLVHFKFAVFGLPMTFAVWCTPLFMVITDLMTRMQGKELARRVLLLTLVPGMIGTLIVGFLYGGDTIGILRITAASGICYLLPMLLDVSIFAWLRERISAWYVAPGVSGVVTSIFITYMFWGIAFAGGADQYLADNWYIIATNQILVKCLLNLLILVPLYGVLLNFLQKRIQGEELAQAQ